MASSSSYEGQEVPIPDFSGEDLRTALKKFAKPDYFTPAHKFAAAMGELATEAFTLMLFASYLQDSDEDSHGEKLVLDQIALVREHINKLIGLVNQDTPLNLTALAVMNRIAEQLNGASSDYAKMTGAVFDRLCRDAHVFAEWGCVPDELESRFDAFRTGFSARGRVEFALQQDLKLKEGKKRRMDAEIKDLIATRVKPGKRGRPPG